MVEDKTTKQNNSYPGDPKMYMHEKELATYLSTLDATRQD